jgi:uncharacterized protein (TIGR02246 family)
VRPNRLTLQTLAAILTLTLVAASEPQAAEKADHTTCGTGAVVDAEAEKQAIRDVIARMEAAWNRGDFRGYMQGFANPDVVFVSRGEFQKDWQGTLDHYIRDYGSSEQTRGTLHFFDIKIEMLGPDAAQLISRYQLNRPDKPQDGINTRLMRKRDGQWVIALNHVSSRELTP